MKKPKSSRVSHFLDEMGNLTDETVLKLELLGGALGIIFISKFPGLFLIF